MDINQETYFDTTKQDTKEGDKDFFQASQIPQVSVKSLQENLPFIIIFFFSALPAQQY